MIVNCVAYQDGHKLADISAEAISDYVRMPDCFVWVALFHPTREELAQMAREFSLHPLAVEDARKGHQRPKIEEYDDSLFAVLHTIDADTDNPATSVVSGAASAVTNLIGGLTGGGTKRRKK